MMHGRKNIKRGMICLFHTSH